MEYQKTRKLLGATSDKMPTFITKKLVKVHYQSGNAEDIYKPSKPIIFKTSMLESYLYDFSGAYIVVKGTITVTNPNDSTYNKKLAFKNNAPFNSCISKTNNTLIGTAEDLDIVMSMYNLLEYSKTYSKTTGSLWNYYWNEPNSGVGSENNNVNYSVKGSKSFDYKTSVIGKFEGINATKGFEWFCCKWSANCVLTSKATTNAVPVQEGNPPVTSVDNPTDATFKITGTKLCIPVVTLSTENDKTLLD